VDEADPLPVHQLLDDGRRRDDAGDERFWRFNGDEQANREVEGAITNRERLEWQTEAEIWTIAFENREVANGVVEGLVACSEEVWSHG
jgi:hypothetical protein